MARCSRKALSLDKSAFGYLYLIAQVVVLSRILSHSLWR
jgi:hypothetical protein